jgi:hypothetical protein
MIIAKEIIIRFNEKDSIIYHEVSIEFKGLHILIMGRENNKDVIVSHKYHLTELDAFEVKLR